MQEGAPAVEKVPAGQLRHTAAPPPEYVPAAQGLHDVEPGFEYSPGPQYVQEVAFITLEYVPPGHREHAAEPMTE